MALWRARALSPEQKAQIADEELDDKSLQMLEEESASTKSDDDSENKSLQNEENGSFLGLEDVSLSVVYSSALSVPVSSSSSPSLKSIYNILGKYTVCKYLMWVLFQSVEFCDGVVQWE